MIKGNQVRIAVVDDDEDDFFIISDYIKYIEGANLVVESISNYQTAIEKIKAAAYHLYFVDYRLGNETRLELLHEVAAMQFDQPIVLLTGNRNKSIYDRAKQSGTRDY